MWALPFFIAIIFWGFVFYIHQKTNDNNKQLLSYLQSHRLQVATESQNGYQQVYYMNDKQKVFVTNEPVNHIQPVADGQYIVWSELINGAGQIVFYNLIDNTTLHLTSTSTNLNPAISQGRVVWERSTEDNNNQVFYYDPKTGVHQLTVEGKSFHPTIYQNKIVYSQRLDESSWQVIEYDIEKNISTTVKKGGVELARPNYVDGKLIFNSLN
jgi:hypothetical protein